MKKILLLFCIILILIVAIPTIFTKRRNILNRIVKENKLEITKYDYSKFSKIKLLHQDTGKIEEVNLDEYIACVVSSEMPVDFELEALKAQSIVARTYTIYKVTTSKKHDNADICDKSTCCQAWISKENRKAKWEKDKAEKNWNKILTAVNSTVGKIITYEGKPINAFFHSNSGGKTEVPMYVWGGKNYPYLQVVETLGEDKYMQYSSEVILTKDEFIEKIKKEHKEFKIDFKNKDCIEIIKRDESDRVIDVKLGNLNLSGVDVRKIFSLKSANFNIENINDKIVFKVIGYGHGVGMSQTGADSLAKEGYDYEQIIKHFYKNVEITNM